MSNFLICEIKGKQYKILPKRPFNVDLGVSSSKDVEGRILFGKSYPKDLVKLTVIENFLGSKLRISKYHAKSNSRRVKGYRSRLTKVSWNP